MEQSRCRRATSKQAIIIHLQDICHSQHNLHPQTALRCLVRIADNRCKQLSRCFIHTHLHFAFFSSFLSTYPFFFFISFPPLHSSSHSPFSLISYALIFSFLLLSPLPPSPRLLSQIFYFPSMSFLFNNCPNFLPTSLSFSFSYDYPIPLFLLFHSSPISFFSPSFLPPRFPFPLISSFLCFHILFLFYFYLAFLA